MAKYKFFVVLGMLTLMSACGGDSNEPAAKSPAVDNSSAKRISDDQLKGHWKAESSAFGAGESSNPYAGPYGGPYAGGSDSPYAGPYGAGPYTGSNGIVVGNMGDSLQSVIFDGAEITLVWATQENCVFLEVIQHQFLESGTLSLNSVSEIKSDPANASSCVAPHVPFTGKYGYLGTYHYSVSASGAVLDVESFGENGNHKLSFVRQ